MGSSSRMRRNPVTAMVDSVSDSAAANPQGEIARVKHLKRALTIAQVSKNHAAHIALVLCRPLRNGAPYILSRSAAIIGSFHYNQYPFNNNKNALRLIWDEDDTSAYHPNRPFSGPLFHLWFAAVTCRPTSTPTHLTSGFRMETRGCSSSRLSVPGLHLAPAL